MTVRRESILKELGIGPLWRLRQSAVAAAVNAPPLPEIPRAAAPTEMPPAAVAIAETIAAESRMSPPLPSSLSSVTNADWEQLTEAILSCRACGLCAARKQAVPGVGDRQADWLFVGEGPGAEEDLRGEPFVGQAGKLLDNMLGAIQLERGADVYIANAVKCRPPENRTPLPDEMETCRPYLLRQIELIRPRLIVALGRPAAQTLLQSEVKIGAARGQLFRHNGIPVIVTYHPAYLLRNLGDKSKAWEDLVFARNTMRQLKQDGIPDV